MAASIVSETNGNTLTSFAVSILFAVVSIVAVIFGSVARLRAENATLAVGDDRVVGASASDLAALASAGVAANRGLQFDQEGAAFGLEGRNGPDAAAEAEVNARIGIDPSWIFRGGAATRSAGQAGPARQMFGFSRAAFPLLVRDLVVPESASVTRVMTGEMVGVVR